MRQALGAGRNLVGRFRPCGRRRRGRSVDPGVAQVDEEGSDGAVGRDPLEVVRLVEPGGLGFAVLPESIKSLSGWRAGGDLPQVLSSVESSPFG